MTETTLAAAARELVAALNGGDADTARAWCTEQAWERGLLPLEPMCLDEQLLLQVAPVMLETDRRAAARLVGFRGDNSRESLWLLFEAREDGWTCVEGCRTRLDAESFLTGRRSPQDHPAAPSQAAAGNTPAPAADRIPTDTALLRAVERLVAALETADADAGRALTEEGHWDLKGETPARLFRHVSQSPSDVGIVEYRVRDDRAAVHIALTSPGGADDVWTVWRLRRGLGWKLLATPSQWVTAGLFLVGRVDDVPQWVGLVPDADAARWGQALVDASKAGSGAPEDVPADAFAVLAEAPEKPSHELRVGETVSLPAIGRAMVRIDVVDPADEFAVDSRWAVLERDRPDAPWRFRRTAGIGALIGLLDGIDVPWEVAPAPEPDPAQAAADAASRRAVMMAVQEVLKANKLDPEALGVDKMSKEELEKLLPKVIGSAFGALFATAFKGLLDGLEQAPPPEGTVDLDRERARRAGAPVPETPFEKELSRMVSGALRDAVKPAARNGTARIDTDFLAQTGPQLLGSLFGAVAKAVVPANVKVDVPAPEGSSEEPVKVEIPLGDLLGQLFGAAAASAKPAQAPNAPADDEEPPANDEEPPADDGKGPEK